MAKLLFWLIIGLVVWLLVKALGRKREAAQRPAARIEDMVRCQVCGVNLPRSEAVLSQGRFYCGPEHREQDQHHG